MNANRNRFDLRPFAFICGKTEFSMIEPNRCYRYFGTEVLVIFSAGSMGLVLKPE